MCHDGRIDQGDSGSDGLFNQCAGGVARAIFADNRRTGKTACFQLSKIGKEAGQSLSAIARQAEKEDARC